jgi:hypothetical protein
MVSTRLPLYHLGRDYYSVYSARAGNTYDVYPVEVDGQLTYECNCRSAERGLVCWHAALIAALPYECKRRAAHREQRRRERDPQAGTPAQQAPARSGHDLLMECFE